MGDHNYARSKEPGVQTEVEIDAASNTTSNNDHQNVSVPLDVMQSTTDPANTDGQVVQNVSVIGQIQVNTVITSNVVPNQSTNPAVVQAVRHPIPNPCATFQLRGNRDQPITQQSLFKILHRMPHVSFFDQYHQRM